MKIYSENILLFIRNCEKMLREIIHNETPHQLGKSRFKIGRYSYPLHVVVFTSKKNLGYFDPHTYQIGLNYALMLQAKDGVLKNILRHELAHYLCYIEHGLQLKHHGVQYQKICSSLGWDTSVSKASMDIELANDYIGNLDSEKLITKIKALLKLAESDNIHEAQLATLKANQLLLKHNIKNLDTVDDTFFVHSLLCYKRKSAKLSAIYDVLKHFLVKPVLVYGKGQVSLEVSGKKENIELAQYVAHFLDQEMERLWQQTSLKGLRAKNSFFLGLARGYDEKMQNLTDDLSTSEQKALIVINDKLEQQTKKYFGRLSTTSCQNSLDKSAYQNGKKAGKSLNIKPGIKNKTQTRLLSWRNT